ISSKVFNADEGDLLGPFALEDHYQLILVEELKRAELNDDVRDVIRQRIFDEWVSQFFKDGIRITA
ncbi:MAG: hypothetical protein JRI34_06005, partial [Deltaproteobacteria bacterium]|nr:hypothetical protein [Deltaproteobacteria bacterium]